jgi:hypothetical protein
MPEHARHRRLVESALLQIGRMKGIFTEFEEMLKSSGQCLKGASEVLERVKTEEREKKNRLPDWMETAQKVSVLRPDTEKLALELRGYAGRLRDHKAKQLFQQMAEEYERLAGKPVGRQNT